MAWVDLLPARERLAGGRAFWVLLKLIGSKGKNSLPPIIRIPSPEIKPASVVEIVWRRSRWESGEYQFGKAEKLDRTAPI